jgi:hypothetical protein
METQYSKTRTDTIAGFERVFGRETIDRSRTDREVPCGGVVLPSRLNAIFLDTHGVGVIAALLGSA